jgi:hypothetical protein
MGLPGWVASLNPERAATAYPLALRRGYSVSRIVRSSNA